MNRKLLPVGEFAQISQVTLATLHHYDKIGLLSPISRGENNYRYYSLRQISQVNLIRTLQELGLSLAEIKDLKERRTPERMAEILKSQLVKIKEKTDRWANANKLIGALLHSILSVRDVDESAVTVSFLPEEPITLGDWNDYGAGEEGYDALVKFYNFISKAYPGIDINYPVWAVFTQENLKTKMQGKHTLPERYYFSAPDGHDRRPAGFYAIGYARGGYGQTERLFVRLRDYIDENGFEVCGDAYEEYPLNEISVADEANYLIRALISVRKK